MLKNFAVGRVHPVEDFPDFSLQEWIQIFDKAARESIDEGGRGRGGGGWR